MSLDTRGAALHLYYFLQKKPTAILKLNAILCEALAGKNTYDVTPGPVSLNEQLDLCINFHMFPDMFRIQAGSKYSIIIFSHSIQTGFTVIYYQ